jgi:tetratricopeptide (TPR) repeat protein
MTSRVLLAGMILILLGVAGCGPSTETSRVEPVPIPLTKEGLYVRGQQLWIDRQADSAAAYFLRSASMDSSFQQPLRDLAQMQYERALQEPEKSRKRTELLRASRAQWIRLETRGLHEADVYERVCELSSTLGDDRTFLTYAKKNAELYPYDRQVFNLARAYYDIEDFQGVIRTAKDAVEKYKESQYVSSFYRIMGKAYTKIDRDQTAERVLVTGLKATDVRIAAVKDAGGDYRATDAYRRLHEDKIQMLLILKQLHTTYKAQDKLQQVERQLKEEGYDR